MHAGCIEACTKNYYNYSICLYNNLIKPQNQPKVIILTVLQYS